MPAFLARCLHCLTRLLQLHIAKRCAVWPMVISYMIQPTVALPVCWMVSHWLHSCSFCIVVELSALSQLHCLYGVDKFSVLPQLQCLCRWHSLQHPTAAMSALTISLLFHSCMSCTVGRLYVAAALHGHQSPSPQSVILCILKPLLIRAGWHVS